MIMCVIGLHCNIRGQVQSGVGVSVRCSPFPPGKRWRRPTEPLRRALQRSEQDADTAEEYVSFLTHRGTLKPPALRGQCTCTASALVQQTHIALISTYALVKPSLLLLLLLLVHPRPLLPSLLPPPPPALCRPVARMDKTLYSPHPVANKANSSSSDRGKSSSRKPGRTGSHSPGSGSLGGPAGAAGSRGAVLGNSMNLQQQQARKRQLEGVLSKYTNLIQGWQNR